MTERWEVGPVPARSIANLHLADPTVPLEAGLAAANDRSVESAQGLLSRWFPTFPVPQLAQTTDAATVQLGPVSPDLAHSPLTAPGLMGRLFDERGYGPANVRLVRNREPQPSGSTLVGRGTAGRTFVHAGSLAVQLDAGYTAVLDGIDLRDGPSMRLAEATERVFGCAVNINGYLSLRREMSFGAHWDDHEVIILQLLGAKHWIVEQPVALSMSKASHPEATSGTVAWEGDLAVGQSLYVPRGWGHRVNSEDSLSFHYTITIPRLHGLEVLSRMLTQAAERGHRAPRVDLGSAEAAGIATAWLTDLASDDAVRWAVASNRASMPSRSTQSLTA
ncbi:MAG TPA: cupin domain-containing protein, partial [Acidimicrobiales bacterium]